MLEVNIREFNRKMYEYIKTLPLIVVNTKTEERLFIVKEVEDCDLRTKNSKKPNPRKG